MTRGTIFLAKLLGLFELVSALTIYANTNQWVAAVTAVVHTPPFLMVLGMIALVAGLALVLGHNVWSGGAATVLVTLFGWTTAFRGVFLLSLPPDSISRIFDLLRFEDNIRIYAIAALAIGIYLTYAGFTAKASVNTDTSPA